MKKILIIAALFLLHLGVKGQNVYWDESVFCKTGILPIGDMPAIRQLLSDEAGKITSIAFRFSGTGQGFFLERRLPNGRPDQSFGTNGRTFVALEVFRSYGEVWAVVRPDGKILINVNFQSVSTPEIPSKKRTMVMCFDTDGSPDSTFGDNGTIELDSWGFNVPVFAAPSNGYFFRVDTNDPALRPVFKHKSDGTLDNSFGDEDQVLFSNFTFRKYGAILSLEDGSLLCGGTGRRVIEDNSIAEFGVMKLNADGTLCSGFGENGLASFDFAEDPVYVTDYASFDCCMNLIVLEDGSILASGTTAGRTHNALLKMHADGTLDTGFGDGGFVLFDYQERHDMQVDRNTGDIIIGGIPGDPFQTTGYSYAITRFDKDGTLLFSEGLTKKEEGSPSCMALRADGRVWLGGYMGGNGFLGRITFDDDFGPAEDDCIGVDETVIEGPEIYAWNNGIVLAGTVEGEDITVYNAAGVMVATAVAGEGETLIPVPGKGLHIVKTSGKAVKVVL